MLPWLVYRVVSGGKELERLRMIGEEKEKERERERTRRIDGGEEERWGI